MDITQEFESLYANWTEPFFRNFLHMKLSDVKQQSAGKISHHTCFKNQHAFQGLMLSTFLVFECTKNHSKNVSNVNSWPFPMELSIASQSLFTQSNSSFDLNPTDFQWMYLIPISEFSSPPWPFQLRLHKKFSMRSSWCILSMLQVNTWFGVQKVVSGNLVFWTGSEGNKNNKFLHQRWQNCSILSDVYGLLSMIACLVNFCVWKLRFCTEHDFRK